MLTSIFNMGEFSLAATAAAMLSALALGIVIAGIYRIKGPCGGGFPVILAILPLLVQCLIMIVNGNLGTSVAVMGAFGLARFRSAPGTAREIGFVFFAMAVGLAAGLGFLTLAVLITAVTGAAVLLLDKTPLGSGGPARGSCALPSRRIWNMPGCLTTCFRPMPKPRAWTGSRPPTWAPCMSSPSLWSCGMWGRKRNLSTSSAAATEIFPLYWGWRKGAGMSYNGAGA